MEKTNLSLQKKSIILALNDFDGSTDIFRLSREEREAAYNKARERIFGKEEMPGDITPGIVTHTHTICH
jgi:hypothetical protein